MTQIRADHAHNALAADNFAVALLNTPNVHTPELQKKVQELLK